MENKKFLFEEDSVWHALAVMALPAIASQLITLVYNIADTWFVGRTNNPYILSMDFRGEKPSKNSVRALFGVGIPAATGIFLFDMCNVVINKLASSYGDTQLAAIGIVLKVERLPLNIGVGICMGMVPLLAYNYSSKNRQRMDAIFCFGRGVGLIIGFISVILYYTFASVIMRTFIGDADTVMYGTQFLRARCFATPLMFLCFSMVHFTQAIGRGKESFYLAVIRQLVFNIPLLFLLSSLFGMTGVVWTQAVADLFTVIVSYIIYARIRKQEGWPAGI
jgi:Na+-driven multidrug efflux pump